MIPLPDVTFVVRGGQNLPANFAQGSGVTVDAGGKNEGSPQQAAGYQTQNLEPSKQLHLDVLTMQLLIRLFAALLLDILPDDFFIAMTPNSAHKVAFGPKLATP